MEITKDVMSLSRRSLIFDLASNLVDLHFSTFHSLLTSLVRLPLSLWTKMKKAFDLLLSLTFCLSLFAVYLRHSPSFSGDAPAAYTVSLKRSALQQATTVEEDVARLKGIVLALNRILIKVHLPIFYHWVGPLLRHLSLLLPHPLCLHLSHCAAPNHRRTAKPV